MQNNRTLVSGKIHHIIFVMKIFSVIHGYDYDFVWMLS